MKITLKELGEIKGIALSLFKDSDPFPHTQEFRDFMLVKAVEHYLIKHTGVSPFEVDYKHSDKI